ncbi:MAG: DUF2064 domain-containing protein [Candidatus Zixiibacteriota bacterium]
MTSRKKKGQVIAVCIQEPFEDGSSMDFGAIQGDDLKFLHQAFITDTITSGLTVNSTADIRIYYIDSPDRKKLIKVVTEYLKMKLPEKIAENLKERVVFSEMEKERWGIRIEKIFKDCFDNGYTSVLAVGSRTPTVSSRMMQTALKLLEKSDAVFGPTPEGRYYSIGMSGSYRVKLSEFDWKSPNIYHDVTEAFETKGLEWGELDIWYAVETPDFLEVMVRDINQFRIEGDETTAHETELVMERLLSKLEK